MATSTDTHFSPNMSQPHTSASPLHATAQNTTLPVPYVPPFNHDVHAWFLHLEAVWQGQNLTQDQHYQAIIRALPNEVFSPLSPLLPTFNPLTRYDASGRWKKCSWMGVAPPKCCDSCNS
ncbi:hypothetical protein Pcinc_039841 [Petrolisthes cinctipes]|uniref:Uncharacterized protein n=1 Tax=Petrolisthes cinctipes TaxID=88211 RepID=A0AAE1BN66_PETCI|nr:hypothetical protein Pcinc_039841 [Petrolisthes cinctipes]